MFTPIITITLSTLSQNISGLDGGGIANAWGTALISDTLVSGNQATNGDGGGAANDYEDVGSELTVYNSTFVNNTASGSGGGIYRAWSAWIRILNSIMTDHTGGDCAGMSTYATFGGNNLIDGTTCSDRVTNPSFRLGAVTNFDTTLRDNGGLTPTHALLPASIAIDVGTGTCLDMLGTALPTDQRGFTRRWIMTGMAAQYATSAPLKRGWMRLPRPR